MEHQMEMSVCYCMPTFDMSIFITTISRSVQLTRHGVGCDWCLINWETSETNNKKKKKIRTKQNRFDATKNWLGHVCHFLSLHNFSKLFHIRLFSASYYTFLFTTFSVFNVALENLTCLIYLENCFAVKSFSTLEPIANINACIMHMYIHIF